MLKGQALAQSKSRACLLVRCVDQAGYQHLLLSLLHLTQPGQPGMLIMQHSLIQARVELPLQDATNGFIQLRSLYPHALQQQPPVTAGAHACRRHHVTGMKLL